MSDLWTDLLTGWYFQGANEIGGWIILLFTSLICCAFIWFDIYSNNHGRKGLWLACVGAPIALFIPTLLLLLGPEAFWLVSWPARLVSALGVLAILISLGTFIAYTLKRLVLRHLSYSLVNPRSGQRTVLKPGTYALTDQVHVQVERGRCWMNVGEGTNITVDGKYVQKVALPVRETCRVSAGAQRFLIVVNE